jgi:hypothetical protein
MYQKSLLSLLIVALKARPTLSTLALICFHYKIAVSITHKANLCCGGKTVS